MIDAVMGQTVGGYAWWRLAAFFAAILGSLVAGKLGGLLLERVAARAERDARPGIAALCRALARAAMLIAFALALNLVAATRLLGLLEGGHIVLNAVARVVTALAIGWMLYRLVDLVDLHLQRVAARTDSRVDDVLAPLVGKSIRITVGVVVLLNVATVISGRNMGTILASLGVGGLAVALAAQDTIRNFFGSLVILGDKPFEIGDRVVIDGFDGPVESVGFRSTKIRTLEGHLVTVPNADVVGRTVHNIGKRPHIRRLANITITYDTPPEKVREAKAILEDILKDHDGMRPDFPPRVFFSGFNDCSLNLIMLYWYHPPDYWAYMAFSERVNLEILTRFNAAGIEFAFPTSTVYLAGDGQCVPALRMIRDDTV
jgi:MscS family membrane protein